MVRIRRTLSEIGPTYGTTSPWFVYNHTWYIKGLCFLPQLLNYSRCHVGPSARSRADHKLKVFLRLPGTLSSSSSVGKSKPRCKEGDLEMKHGIVPRSPSL